MKTYYKVVRADFSSCFVEGKASVKYQIEEYVSAPTWLPVDHQVLFVFGSLKAAELFVDRLFKSAPDLIVEFLRVYACKVKKITRLPFYLNSVTLSSGIIFHGHGTFPPGTVAVREVKLTREVEA